MRRFALGILMVLLLPLTACSISAGDYGHDRYPRYGGYYPPPDARWRWDDDLRVYVNPGFPYIYYQDRTYYRWHGNHWSSGQRYNGPWRVIEHRHVPSRLGQRHYPRYRYDNRPDHDWRRDGREGRWERHDDRWDGRDRLDDRQRREFEQHRRSLQQRERDDRWDRRDDHQGRQWQPQRLDGRQDRQPRDERQWNDRRHEQRHERTQQTDERREREVRRSLTGSSGRGDDGRGSRSERHWQGRDGGQWDGHRER